MEGNVQQPRLFYYLMWQYSIQILHPPVLKIHCLKRELKTLVLLTFICLPWSSKAKSWNTSGTSSMKSSLVVVEIPNECITSTTTSHFKICSVWTSCARTTARFLMSSLVTVITSALEEQSKSWFASIKLSLMMSLLVVLLKCENFLTNNRK